MEFYFHEADQDVLVVAVDGGLDRTTVGEFVEGIEKMIDAGLTHIIVDCAQLDYIASAGFTTLLQIHHKMKPRGGRVALANLSGAVWQLIRSMQLHRLIGAYDSVEQARLALKD